MARKKFFCPECYCDNCEKEKLRIKEQEWPALLKRWVKAAKLDGMNIEDDVLDEFRRHREQFKFCPHGTRSPIIAARESKYWSMETLGLYSSRNKEWTCVGHHWRLGRNRDGSMDLNKDCHMW